MKATPLPRRGTARGSHASAIDSGGGHVGAFRTRTRAIVYCQPTAHLLVLAPLPHGSVVVCALDPRGCAYVVCSCGGPQAGRRDRVCPFASARSDLTRPTCPPSPSYLSTTSPPPTLLGLLLPFLSSHLVLRLPSRSRWRTPRRLTRRTRRPSTYSTLTDLVQASTPCPTTRRQDSKQGLEM